MEIFIADPPQVRTHHPPMEEALGVAALAARLNRAYVGLHAARGRSAYALDLELDEFRVDAGRVDANPCQGHREREASRSSTPRVQVEHPSLALQHRLMGVSGNDGVEARRLGIEIKLRQVVQDVEGKAAKLYRLGGVEALRPSAGVVVAAHRHDGGDLTQRFEHRRMSHIPRVHNQVGATERGDGLRSEETVGVGNHAEGGLLLHCDGPDCDPVADHSATRGAGPPGGSRPGVSGREILGV